jgi:hypothetical protein
MSFFDAIATGILATLGIALGLVVAAFTVAFFGVYICIAVILFTDAENNPQFMTTLLAFWCIQTIFFVLSIIFGYYGKDNISEYCSKDKNNAFDYIGFLVTAIIHVFVALLLFTDLENNPQFMTTLLVLWSIFTACFGISCILRYCCACIPTFCGGTRQERIPIILESQTPE